jgi:hypothetical protein
MALFDYHGLLNIELYWTTINYNKKHSNKVKDDVRIVS